MNDRLKICRRILQTTGGVALLLRGGCAGAGENSGGVLGILKFAQQYQQQEASAIKHKRGRFRRKNGHGLGSNTELRRRLTLREQEIRQLKSAGTESPAGCDSRIKVPSGATIVYTLRVEEVKPTAETMFDESVGKNMSSLAGKNDKTCRTEGVKK